jgi:hypothetical protein
MPQPPLPQPPAGSVTVTLTPDQWKLLQQLLHLGPPHLNLPLSTGTIGFDIFPNTITALPSGTDLTQHQLYQLIDGVTFSADPGPGGVYAVTDPSGRSRNVLSLAAPPTIPWFNAHTGAIKATFNPPVRTASIDAAPGVFETGEVKNEPYIAAFDASGAFIPNTEILYPFQHGDPRWGTWQTLTIARPQADIAAVEFSVQQTQGGSDVLGIFDNLHYER